MVVVVVAELLLVAEYMPVEVLVLMVVVGVCWVVVVDPPLLVVRGCWRRQLDGWCNGCRKVEADCVCTLALVVGCPCDSCLHWMVGGSRCRRRLLGFVWVQNSDPVVCCGGGVVVLPVVVILVGAVLSCVVVVLALS